MSLVADEVAQVTVLHVGKNHEWRALRWQADTQQRENVGVAEVLHDDTLLQELGYLLQICDAFTETKKVGNSATVFTSLVERANLFVDYSIHIFWDLYMQYDFIHVWRDSIHKIVQITGTDIAPISEVFPYVLFGIKDDGDGAQAKRKKTSISSPRPDPHQTPICQLHPCL